MGETLVPRAVAQGRPLRALAVVADQVSARDWLVTCGRVLHLGLPAEADCEGGGERRVTSVRKHEHIGTASLC